MLEFITKGFELLKHLILMNTPLNKFNYWGWSMKFWASYYSQSNFKFGYYIEIDEITFLITLNRSTLYMLRLHTFICHISTKIFKVAHMTHTWRKNMCTWQLRAGTPTYTMYITYMIIKMHSLQVYVCSFFFPVLFVFYYALCV